MEWWNRASALLRKAKGLKAEGVNLNFERILLLILPYGATSIKSLPAVQAHIKLLRDKDLSWDFGISRDIPGIPGIWKIYPGISASLSTIWSLIFKQLDLIVDFIQIGQKSTICVFSTYGTLNLTDGASTLWSLVLLLHTIAQTTNHGFLRGKLTEAEYLVTLAYGT